MKRALLASLFGVSFIAIASCSGASEFDYIDHIPPPSINLQAVSVDSGGVLKITVTASNPNRVSLQVAHTPECPFAVRIFSDPTGEQIGESGVSCASIASTSDLAPGKSLVLSRIYSAADLAQYAPGVYGINVTVGTPTSNVSTWGGAVRLPLTSKP